MIVRNNKKVIGVSKGNTPITKIYKGDKVVWEKTTKWELPLFTIELVDDYPFNIPISHTFKIKKIRGRLPVEGFTLGVWANGAPGKAKFEYYNNMDEVLVNIRPGIDYNYYMLNNMFILLDEDFIEDYNLENLLNLPSKYNVYLTEIYNFEKEYEYYLAYKDINTQKSLYAPIEDYQKLLEEGQIIDGVLYGDIIIGLQQTYGTYQLCKEYCDSYSTNGIESGKWRIGNVSWGTIGNYENLNEIMSLIGGDTFIYESWYWENGSNFVVQVGTSSGKQVSGSGSYKACLLTDAYFIDAND